MNIIEIIDKEKKSEITNKILRALPAWFGIESAIVDYVIDVKPMKFWAANENDQEIGFIAINKHFDKSAEIHVMGILESHHRKGVGKLLVKKAESYLKDNSIPFLQVKTLSPAHPDKGYAQTRKFYQNIGFTPIEEFKTLWGEANPALMMMKYIS